MLKRLKLRQRLSTSARLSLCRKSLLVPLKVHQRNTSNLCQLLPRSYLRLNCSPWTIQLTSVKQSPSTTKTYIPKVSMTPWSKVSPQRSPSQYTNNTQHRKSQSLLSSLSPGKATDNLCRVTTSQLRRFNQRHLCTQTK